MVKKSLPVPLDPKKFRFVADRHGSPDGGSVIFVVTRMIEEEEKDGRKPIPLTSGR
jgi:hypothetical protein